MRCEQGAKGGGGLDVWLSRGAMLGFVGAVAVELTTGKGVLQVCLPLLTHRVDPWHAFLVNGLNFGCCRMWD